jgi:cytoskeletal protein CcmA (bactofilin family)
MWSNKKPETPQAAEPEPRKINFNEPPKPAPAAWEGTTKMATGSDAIRPLGNTGDRTGTGARLGSSLHVKGEISGNEDLLIDGTVEGLITLDERKLTVGASAKVTADIIAREVVVYGTVKGNLRAKDRIEIKKDGSVNGDLTTARIMIEDGAYFKGSVEIDRTSDKESSGANAFARTPATAKTI